MAYPESCFSDLIGIRGVCNETTAAFYLDDIPGMSVNDLAQVADGAAPTGQKLGQKIIESAARLMAADVNAIYDAQYKVESSLVNGCSNCSFTNTYLSGTKLGVLVKDNTTSAFTQMIIDKLVIKTNSTGLFTFVLDDGTSNNVKTFEYDFTAGIEYEFSNLNYNTRQKRVSIYFEDAGVLLAELSCPRTGSGCGCSGSSKVVNDLVYTGTSNGSEQQKAYGFIPCVFIRCEAQDLLCFTAKSAPNMIGMALLYKSAELFFNTTLLSQRNNKVVGVDNEFKKEEMEKYRGLYTSKLVGKNTRGVKDVVLTTLRNTNDVCVVCDAKISTAWATT